MKKYLIITGLILSLTMSAQVQVIPVGTVANDHTGIALRTAWQIQNANNAWLANQIATKGGGMEYPAAGIPLSTGTTWGTSITNNSANWNNAYTDRLKWDGGATGLVAATGRTSLGATTVGGSLFTLANPGVISYIQISAGNTASAISAATMKSALSFNAADVGLGNVTNESKATMFTNAALTSVPTAPTAATTTNTTQIATTAYSFARAVKTANDSLNALRATAIDISTIVMMKNPVPNVRTVSYTLQTSDNGGVVLMNLATANNVTITSGMPLYSQINVLTNGAGKSTLVLTGGQTISNTALRGITVGKAVYLYQWSANNWWVTGGME